MRISDWSSDVCSSDLLTSAVLAVPAIYFATQYALGDLNAVIGGSEAGTGFTGMDLFWCMMIGLALTGVLVWVTEYYTGTNFRPVRSIAKASETGHGTNVIQGLAVSLESPALPTVAIRSEEHTSELQSLMR